MHNDFIEQKLKPLLTIQEELQTADMESELLKELNRTLKTENSTLAEQLGLLESEIRELELQNKMNRTKLESTKQSFERAKHRQEIERKLASDCRIGVTVGELRNAIDLITKF